MVVKDEADILESVLHAALSWSDFIYILDNGSTDDSINIILKIFNMYKGRIYFLGQDVSPFNNSLRSKLFAAYRKNFLNGDWICRLDADEIFHDNPAVFCKNLDSSISCIEASMYQFYFTEIELDVFKKNKYLKKISKPENFFIHYKNDFSELRFFRYRAFMHWGESAWPRFLGFPAKVNIRVRHYKYRSPDQMERRYLNRINSVEGFDHLKSVSGYGLDVINSLECYKFTDKSNLVSEKTFSVPRERSISLLAFVLYKFNLHKIFEFLNHFLRLTIRSL